MIPVSVCTYCRSNGLAGTTVYQITATAVIVSPSSMV